MQIFSFFFFLLILSILPPDNIIYVNGKILRKKDKHVKQERIDMGMGQMMKYAAKGAALYAGYLVAKPTLIKVNNLRKKSQHYFKKNLKKPNEKKKTHKKFEKMFLEKRNFYLHGIEQTQQDIIKKRADLSETLGIMHIKINSYKKDSNDLIRTIESYLDTDIDEEQIQLQAQRKKQQKLEQYQKELEDIDRQMKQYVTNDQNGMIDNSKNYNQIISQILKVIIYNFCKLIQEQYYFQKFNCKYRLKDMIESA